MSFLSPKPSLSLVYHVGSSAVGAALVRMPVRGKASAKSGADERPHVLAAVRDQFPYRKDADPERFMADMLSAVSRADARLAKAAEEVMKKEGKPSHALFVLASPWCAVQTKVVNVKEPAPFEVTKAFLDKIVSAHERMFESETPGAGLQPIEERVTQVRLNGYEVADPYGKRASEAEVSIFVSLAPKAVVDKVLDAAGMAARHCARRRAFASFSLASFTAARDVYHERDDFAFIDVGSALTDVSVARGGLVSATASFPTGSAAIIATVAKAFATTPAEAESLIRLVQEGHADKAVEEKVRPVLDKAADGWLADVKESLSGLALKAAPHDAFVLVEGSESGALAGALMAAIDRADAFSAKLVGANALATCAAFEKGVERLPALAICASFAVRMFGSDQG